MFMEVTKDTGCYRRQDRWFRSCNVLKRSKKEKRLEDWEEKVLHGQYLRQTKEEVISVRLGFRMEI